MKTRAFLLLLLLPALACGQKISDLPATSTAAATSVLPIVHSGAATANKMTVPNLGLTLLSNQPALVGTSAIGVSVQGYSANTTVLGNSVTGTGSIARNITPTFQGNVTVGSINGNVITAGTGTLTLGAGTNNFTPLTASSINGNVITAGSGTLTLGAGLTLTAGATGNAAISSQQITLSGSTAATTLTLPSTSAVSLAGLNVSQTYTGTPTFSSGLIGSSTSDFTIGGQTTRLGSSGISLLSSGAHLALTSTGNISWNSDLYASRDAAAVLQFGVDHATTATAQTHKAHDVTTGTGAKMIVAGGKGSAAGGAVELATSASTAAPTAGLILGADGVLDFARSVVSAAVATVSTDKIAIKVNGVTYYILVTTVP